MSQRFLLAGVRGWVARLDTAKGSRMAVPNGIRDLAPSRAGPSAASWGVTLDRIERAGRVPSARPDVMVRR